MDIGTGSSSEDDINSSVKLYLQVRTVLHELSVEQEDDKWFVVNGDDNIVEEVRGMSHKFPIYTVSAFSDSTVFVFGGRDILRNSKRDFLEGINFRSPDLWYADTFVVVDNENHGSSSVYASRKGWIPGPPMCIPRSGGCAVAVDQKIYVFGGVRWPTGSTWAEVYDTKLERWSVLEPPNYIYSLYVRDCVLVIFDWETKKKRFILIYTLRDGFLWSYDLDKGVWDLFDPQFGSFVCDVVYVSGTPFLLTIKNCVIHGYHLVRKEWFQSPVCGLEGNNVLPCRSDFSVKQYYLVSMGCNGKLCVLWTKYSSIDFRVLLVYCTKFTVYEDGTSLVAKVDPTVVYNLVNGDYLHGCLALAPRQVKKGVGESSYMEEDVWEEKKFNNCDHGHLNHKEI